ncbi:MAG: SDR family oxidoreductase [Mesorhizobium sp.]|nr:MAG: SDR family oxidoreductase [Mesorhizobium sp.]TIU96456.1 MAG: SDR family oxidoreductase [Mesorhizobium sp.]
MRQDARLLHSRAGRSASPLAHWLDRDDVRRGGGPPSRYGFSLLAAEGASIPGFGKALARELSPVRVTVVMAGLVDTPIKSARREQSAKWAETSLPARRFGQPEDLADAIIFAMRNPYTTGGILVVDGGLLIA